MSVLKYFLNFFNDTIPIHIVPFGGYANNDMIHGQARVLKNHDIHQSEEDSPLKNLWNSFKRFESDERKGVAVNVTWGNHEVILISDDEGYIYLDQPLRQKYNDAAMIWVPITYQLLHQGKIVFQVISYAMRPSLQSDFGIISDLDDTVMHTGVTSILKWRLFVNSFMKHSSKRLPLEGAQMFYDLLSKGRSGNNTNPFFYLSNSPWNLYEYLQAFLQKFNFPKGILLLRDFSFSLKRKSSFMERNKYKRIVHILETYPTLQFILIGDAAEIDADIYLTIARQFPNRILSIYIRAVNRTSNMTRVQKVIKENKDINMVLVKESTQAIEHARSCGYIS